MSEKYKIGDENKLYFVTFGVIKWIDVFSRREYKDLVLESLTYCQLEKGLEIYGWCIMSNHIHLIIGKERELGIAEIIRDFKKYTSVHICKSIENNMQESRREWMLSLFSEAAAISKKHDKYMFWQNEYHPVELSTHEMMVQKLDYIHRNPIETGVVDKAEDYVYSSARDYYGTTKGLINIKFIEK